MRHMPRGAAALLALLLALPALELSAQELRLSDESRVWVEGTSNRSDWTVYAKEVDASALVEDGLTPSNLQVTITSREIKSDQSTIMDRLMHEALKVTEHPTITYELASADSDGARLNTAGRLTLGGVTRDVEMSVEAQEVAGGGVRYSGSIPLKMTDYDLQPPVAMFGALRTADEVTVHFDVTFVPAG